MDAARLSPPRRLDIPIDNRWGAGTMSVLDFGPENRSVDLIFVHANGFHGATYRRLLAPLSASFRILAPDLRGHGLSRLPAPPTWRRNWFDYRDDLTVLLDQMDGPPVVLAGHSMGATSALMAAAERPDRVSAMVLCDPVFMSRTHVALMSTPGLGRLARYWPITRGALRRRDRFASREEAMQRFRGRGAFRGWPDMILADYVGDGLIDDGEGQVRLACAPAWEASNYAAQAHNPWRELHRLSCPIRICVAETGSITALKTSPFSRPNITVETIPGGGHMFPMTHTDIVRDRLFDATV